MNEALVWAIIFLPLMSFIFISLFIRPVLGPSSRWSSLLTSGSIGLAFILSFWALLSVWGQSFEFPSHIWFIVDEANSVQQFVMTVGIILDPLTATMLVVVTGVSLLVQVYSQGYLQNHDQKLDPSYSRYFAYMGLFTFSMLGLVTSLNLIQLFVFWELVGLSSYLLIGFWHQRPAAAAAAKKAFLVTRIGDFGFILALLYLFSKRQFFYELGLNPFEIPDIISVAPLLGSTTATWIALGLFAGAVGKSAQFPLHTWLPDAMEGPTPVSSLIHAATMVAAGVFLVTRFFPLFEASGIALIWVALIGSSTALFAATMGLVANDIKRVLAFSTVSQLGFMFIALGVGMPVVAMFHLTTHAFFKCLLFLASGSVHHSVKTFDMRYMGGLRKQLPYTYCLAFVGVLALSGIFPFAGFWSKDEILLSAWEGSHAYSFGVSQLAFWIGLIVSCLTSFYAFRMLHMTFHGEFRGGIDAIPKDLRQPYEVDEKVHLSESPWQMLVPMFLLAVLAIFAGFVLASPVQILYLPAHVFMHLFTDQDGHFHFGVALASTFASFFGIFLATAIYQLKLTKNWAFGDSFEPVRKILIQRYYFDHFYEGFIVKTIGYKGIFATSDWVDRHIIDGFADLISWFGRNTGRAFAQLQTGQLQVYGIGISLGAATIVLAYMASR